jgi:hypothetical protein
MSLRIVSMPNALVYGTQYLSHADDSLLRVVLGAAQCVACRKSCRSKQGSPAAESLRVLATPIRYSKRCFGAVVGKGASDSSVSSSTGSLALEEPNMVLKFCGG